MVTPSGKIAGMFCEKVEDVYGRRLETMRVCLYCQQWVTEIIKRPFLMIILAIVTPIHQTIKVKYAEIIGLSPGHFLKELMKLVLSSVAV
jgi:hypothetical protein